MTPAPTITLLTHASLTTHFLTLFSPLLLQFPNLRFACHLCRFDLQSKFEGRSLTKVCEGFQFSNVCREQITLEKNIGFQYSIRSTHRLIVGDRRGALPDWGRHKLIGFPSTCSIASNTPQQPIPLTVPICLNECLPPCSHCLSLSLQGLWFSAAAAAIAAGLWFRGPTPEGRGLAAARRRGESPQRQARR